MITQPGLTLSARYSLVTDLEMFRTRSTGKILTITAVGQRYLMTGERIMSERNT